METFDLESHLQDAYSRFPEAKHQPVIGLTANYEGIDATLRDRYYKQVIAAGGTPVIIPPVADAQVIVNTLEHLDGLILTGGGDHNPLWMGEEPSPRLHNINQERDAAELMITRLAFNRQIPMLGICRGIQTLAIALGGKVCQDIKQLVKHSQDADRTEPTHIVEIKKDSMLLDIKTSIPSSYQNIIKFRAIDWRTYIIPAFLRFFLIHSKLCLCLQAYAEQTD